MSGQAIQDGTTANGPVVIDRPQAGKPHAGKVLAAIQPHCDDIPLFAAGAVIRLIDEGYTGHLIRVSNDDMAGPGTTGNTVLQNERDNQAVARALGCRSVFDLNYSNHQMDQESRLEMRARLIFLFRLLKVDTVVCYDPWGHYEENPDHSVTAQVVEAACWMAGGSKDYPEHFAAGLQPHGVSEKYYFARGPQLVNRVMDISSVIDRKVAVNRLNVTQGPAGQSGAALRKSLAERGLQIPLLGDDDESAANNYIKYYVLERDRQVGARHGLEFAEPYHYIGPPADTQQDFVRRHAVPLK
ncbi:PIG-L family deacetylase [uncultured Paludibaculum sp.]|uniref:PIG-L deacetylase family protein n=1 Tax=uncultured Paludibaculum sp. TaxID=1765020 RepID=UPI002AAADDD5|nr:PIG-L family deacetylase [uncultured Paludibaculum sp.]